AAPGALRPASRPLRLRLLSVAPEERNHVQVGGACTRIRPVSNHRGAATGSGESALRPWQIQYDITNLGSPPARKRSVNLWTIQPQSAGGSCPGRSGRT